MNHIQGCNCQSPIPGWMYWNSTVLLQKKWWYRQQMNLYPFGVCKSGSAEGRGTHPGRRVFGVCVNTVCVPLQQILQVIHLVWTAAHERRLGLDSSKSWCSWATLELFKQQDSFIWLWSWGRWAHRERQATKGISIAIGWACLVHQVVLIHP